MSKTLLVSLGGVGAAFLGALCCAGPILFVTLGIGAGLGGTFEPLRPWFGAVMVGLFALAFYSVYGRRTASDTGLSGMKGGACAVPRNRTRERSILWTALAIALVFWTFPTWSVWLV